MSFLFFYAQSDDTDDANQCLSKQSVRQCIHEIDNGQIRKKIFRKFLERKILFRVPEHDVSSAVPFQCKCQYLMI